MPRQRWTSRHDDDERRPAGRPAVQRGVDSVDRLLHQAGDDPDRIGRQLAGADEATQTRAFERLNDAHGNAFLGHVVRSIAGSRASAGDVHRRTTRIELTSSAGAGFGATTGTSASTVRQPGVGRVQREEGVVPVEEPPLPELPVEGAQPLSGGGAGATEVIGPPTPSSYAVTASSLADVAAQLSSRDEAGHVDWTLGLDFTQTDGKVDGVTVTAAISLEMPSWTPPASMLPKARAEWVRWYAALQAHEDGHVKLVHDHFDGLAAKLIGKTPDTANTMFATAKAKLKKASKAYDTTTNHGLKTGTVMDVSIEDKEIDEEKKKKAAEEEARKKAAPAP